MKKQFVTLFAVASVCCAALATPQSFDFKDPKGVNNAVFKLDAPLKPSPVARTESPARSFDPANPGPRRKNRRRRSTPSAEPMMKGTSQRRDGCCQQREILG
jgi:hypothetical protein